MRKALHTSVGWTNRIANALRRYSLVHTAAIGAVALGAAGQATAQPEPPYFEAHMLERVEPRNGFDDYGYRVHAMADDGTVYGTVYNRQQNRFKAIKSRVGEGTTWLLPRDPEVVEVQTVAASTSGVALLFVWAWPENYIFVPNRGVREINSLHTDLFFAFDMNNEHVMVGQTGVNPRRAVAFRPPDEFTHLAPETSAALKINQVGSIVGFVSSTPEDITFRVWHADGRQSDFVVRRLSLVDVEDMNNRDEVVGFHLRRDSLGQVRWGGWFWSERTGVVEIPFRYEGPEGGSDVQIFGLSDDGWVLGREGRIDGPEFYREAFLWHVDVGFVNLADLWEWQGRFDPRQVFLGAVNGPGQIAIETFSITLNRWVYVFLDPIK